MPRRKTPGGPGSTGTSSIDPRVVDGLVQLSFLIQSVLARVGAAHELSIVQTRLLGVVRDREIGMLELARILELEKSSVTGLVDRAERRGLVQRVAVVNDRRAVRVILTPAGQALVRAASEEVNVAIAQLVAGLGPVEQTRLAELTTSLVATAAASRDVAV